MTRVTLGKMLLDTARGDDAHRSIPEGQMEELGQGIMERALPQIDNLREEQRKATEEGRASVLRKRRGR
jgi:hypothetical protein